MLKRHKLCLMVSAFALAGLTVYGCPDEPPIVCHPDDPICNNIVGGCETDDCCKEVGTCCDDGICCSKKCKEVPSVCKVGVSCLNETQCNAGEALMWCRCASSPNLTQTDARCRGMSYNRCHSDIGSCDWAGCRPPLKLEEGSDCNTGCDDLVINDQTVMTAEQLERGCCTLALALQYPGADFDGDGIPNGIEITAGWNPCNPDTDGDGVPDGMEDLNRDGKIETILGETDPNDPHSKPNVEGGEAHARAAVCNYDTMIAGGTSEAFNRMRIAKFEDVNYTVHGGQVATFNDIANNVYGFFVRGDSHEGKILFSTAFPAGNDIIHSFIEESNFTSSVPLASWIESEIYMKELQVVPDHRVQRLKYAVELKADKSLEEFRNALVKPLASSVSISASSSRTLCNGGEDGARANVSLSRSIHTEGHVIYGMAVACESTVRSGSVAAINRMDDVISGTMAASSDYVPFRRFVCQSKHFGDATGMVDFIWVVDNSGSMADELENVANTANLFVDRLVTSGIDYRVAVTTTDSFIVDEWPAAVGGATGRNSADYFNPMALRHRVAPWGFLSTNPTGLKTEFVAMVSLWGACTRFGASGKNICGWGREDGFRSGVVALQRLTDDFPTKLAYCSSSSLTATVEHIEGLCHPETGTKPSDPKCTDMSLQGYGCFYDPKHPDCHTRMSRCSLREKALKYIVWVSDEESRQFKEPVDMDNNGYFSINENNGLPEANAPRICICKTGYALKVDQEIVEGSVKYEYSMHKGEFDATYNPTTGTCTLKPGVVAEGYCNPKLAPVFAGGQFAFDETSTLEEVYEKNPDYYHMLQYYMQQYRKYAGEGGIAAFAIVGDHKALGGYCAALDGNNPAATEGSDYGLSYILAARYLSAGEDGTGKGGGYASICNPQFDQIVSSIVEDAVGRVGSHPLKGYPISSTIRVSMNTQADVIELTRGATTNGWRYDASQNAIVFSGLNPAPNATDYIAIAYVIWTKDEG